MLLGWVAYRDRSVLTAVAPAPANCSTVVTFDSISTSSSGAGSNISVGFNGLEWGNWTVVNASAANAAAAAHLFAGGSGNETGASANNQTLYATGCANPSLSM